MSLSILTRIKIQCRYDADLRVAGSKLGRVNQVNLVSSSVEASRWCAITHVKSNSLIR